ncbi:MAG: RsmB/NOP family class I SAM-dependent RNA methyltransferase [Methylocystis sp.]|nr:RsmB/NOP family class I SAM-dependent RNA methyltransferase [Methylocystis sp.]MCA3584378.1 RsmB/NOP family class I SAM-dependent RNA methyltransferase [Methylocystis sp.]MCA3587395.1 RsmB/NOP family class I SAM-dependent RNA methyltransferase [Methylocystis sp.]MCA3592601.1 RsmB/NOP family class I SAM-dependent RNA methyltransferase [Methylocystis sp.]
MPVRPDGLAARRMASQVIEDIIRRRLPLDEQLEKLSRTPAFQALQANDRGLTRAIATAALRRLGLIRHVLSERMQQGFPPRGGSLESIMIGAVAQILVLETAAHAAVDTAVTLVREDPHARHFADLANAVLRRIAAEKQAILSEADPLARDTPEWLAARWRRAYGDETASAIAAAHLREPSIDLTVKSDPEGWADRLGGVLLPTGSIRLTIRTAIPQLPGFAEGEWWVQDAAAALPARLLGAEPGETVFDLCAAPGGKTAQLALTGARVIAVDRSAPRLERLQENLERLRLTAQTHAADAMAFQGDGRPDRILIDAPCSATGTIRRHPDVAWSKTLEDIHKLAALQARLLDHAAKLVKQGGTIVYATCSLEPEEGERQIERFLARHPGFRRSPVAPAEIGGQAQLISPAGELRCLPSHWPDPQDRLSGMDGFFAARLAHG